MGYTATLAIIKSWIIKKQLKHLSDEKIGIFNIRLGEEKPMPGCLTLQGKSSPLSEVPIIFIDQYGHPLLRSTLLPVKIKLLHKVKTFWIQF